MAVLKVEVPDELKRSVERLKINVSPAVVRALENELSRFVALRLLASKSRLSGKDAIELGRLLKRSRAERLRKAGS